MALRFRVELLHNFLFVDTCEELLLGFELGLFLRGAVLLCCAETHLLAEVINDFGAVNSTLEEVLLHEENCHVHLELPLGDETVLLVMDSLHQLVK